MNSRIRPITRMLTLALAAFLLLQGTALAAGAGTRIYHNSLRVSDTLTYDNIAATNDRGRQEGYALTYMPGGDIEAIVSAGSSIYGASNINSVISHAQDQGYNVLGGVNADFFSFSTGVMEGIYISDGQLMSSHHGTSAVLFDENGSAFVSDPTLTFTLTNQGGGSASNAGKSVSVPFYNKYRQSGYLFLYDSNYASTTRTSSSGKEVIFRVLEGDVKVGGSVSMVVDRVTSSSGSVNLDDGYIVLSADAACPYIGELDKFAAGDMVTLNVSSTDSRAASAVWGTGGGDVIVSGGAKTSSSGWDSSLTSANPRTAIGIKADGSVMLYVADGRQSGYAVGLTMTELADEMIALGCVDVVNLDGGGSSTFSYRYPGNNSTSTINRPSDGSLRSCSTYILLTSKNYGDGQAAFVQFDQTATTVLGGSLFTAGDLASVSMALDKGYYPASTDNLVFTTYSADETLGTQEGDGFRTQKVNASGDVAAYTDSGAKGTLGISVVTTPSAIDVRAGGQSLSTLRVASGDQIKLNYTATYGGSTIYSTNDAYNVTLTESVGTVDADGNFTATGSPGSTGTLTVYTGGTTQTVEMVIANYFADTDGHWAEAAIGQMKEAGVITGYDTSLGTYFYPGQDITRAEFATMLTRLLGIDETQYSLTGNEFLDHDSIPNWARPYAAAMYQLGYINGKAVTGGVNFDATATITRAEAFTILGRLLDTSASTSVLNRFSDASDVPSWAAEEIAKLVQAGLLTGYDDGTLRPLNSISRAEAATTLARLDVSALALEAAEALPEDADEPETLTAPEPDEGEAEDIPDQAELEFTEEPAA